MKFLFEMPDRIHGIKNFAAGMILAGLRQRGKILRMLGAGQRHPDDFEVIWRGIAIGRIMRASDATPGKPRNGRGAATLAGRKAPTTEGPASTSTTPRRISEPHGRASAPGSPAGAPVVESVHEPGGPAPVVARIPQVALFAPTQVFGQSADV